MIPASLWSENKLRLPQLLVDHIRDELIFREKFDEACGPSPSHDKLYGGEGMVETISHFTHRFKTSAARVQFVTLNPNGTFTPYADELRACLFDGNVALLDLACGSGGGLFGLLASLAELRRTGYAAPMPTEISILAADCSAEARAIHASMANRLQPALSLHGLRISTNYMDWDVTKPFSTTALMDQWFLLCPETDLYLVFISAFSGFMSKNTDVVLEAVRDIAKRLHDKSFHVAWIEPSSNDSDKVIPKIYHALLGLFGLSSKGKGTEPKEKFVYVHPFTSEELNGQASVVPWERIS